jgi:hypothetical protein
MSVSALDKYSTYCGNFAKSYTEETQRLQVLERKFVEWNKCSLISLPALHIAAALDDDLSMQVILKGFAARDRWLADPVFGPWKHYPLRTSVLLGSSPEKCVKILLDYEAQYFFGISRNSYRTIMQADDYFYLRVTTARGLWQAFEILLKYELFNSADSWTRSTRVHRLWI